MSSRQLCGLRAEGELVSTGIEEREGERTNLLLEICPFC